VAAHQTLFPAGPAADPAVLRVVRAARGLTQAQLGAASDVSQGFLSKAEVGAVQLEGERLQRVADVLGCPVSLLTSAAGNYPGTSACVFHRKRSTLPVSVAKRVRALLDLTRIQVEPLLDEQTPPVRLLRRSPSPDGWDTPEDIARETRTSLGITPGPVSNLVAAVEAVGVVVVRRDLGNRRVDAIGQWPDDRRPLFLANATAPGERQRYTFAHELGHAVMHPGPREEQETEADRFAAELLMPAREMRDVLEDVTLSRLVELKRAWRVSLAALVRRAHQLGAISDHRYRGLNVELSTSGYRMREPEALLAERPSLVYQTVTRRREAGMDDAAIAALAKMTVAEFQGLYGTQENA
jgi:Zn-dependent peptidase ImmA (M78 family)/transcriptional regulator with XRE-family HTH domain